jgi:hypothetical protein
MAATLTPNLEQLDRDIAELTAIKEHQAAERQREAQRAAQRQAEIAAAELEKRIDHLKASVPSLDTITDALDATRATVPAFGAAVAQRTQAANTAITDAHSVTSPRVQVGPNSSWVVIDRARISTQRDQIGTEAAQLCAEILSAAGETALAMTCRDRVRGGNRLQKGN